MASDEDLVTEENLRPSLRAGNTKGHQHQTGEKTQHGRHGRQEASRVNSREARLLERSGVGAGVGTAVVGTTVVGMAVVGTAGVNR